MKRFSVCTGESCRALGADAVWSAARRWHAELGLSSSCTLAHADCLGRCSEGPNAAVDGVEHTELDPLKMARLLHDLRQQV